MRIRLRRRALPSWQERHRARQTPHNIQPIGSGVVWVQRRLRFTHHGNNRSGHLRTQIAVRDAPRENARRCACADEAWILPMRMAPGKPDFGRLMARRDPDLYGSGRPGSGPPGFVPATSWYYSDSADTSAAAGLSGTSLFQTPAFNLIAAPMVAIAMATSSTTLSRNRLQPCPTASPI